MTTVDLLAEACLRVAASRWPAEIRDEMYREWSAEMHAMKSEEPGSPWRRARAQLGYTFSLAVSPPPGTGEQRGWRTSLSGGQRGAMPLIALFGLGMVLDLMLRGVRATAGFAALGGPPPDWVMTAVKSVVTVIAVVLLAALGNWVGRRAPVPHGDTLGGRAWGAMAAPVMVGAGMIVTQITFVSRVPEGTVAGFVLPPSLWIVLMLPIAAWAARRARRGEPRLGRVVAAGISLSLLPGLALTVALASGVPIGGALLSLIAPAGHPNGVIAVEVLSLLPPATAFVLWYATRSARTAVTVVADTSEAGHEPATKTVFALSLATAAVAMWAISATLVYDTAQRLSTMYYDVLVGWAYELRYTAILLAAVSVAVALARYGHTLLPAVGTAIALLAVDAVILATGRTGVTGLGAALFAGLLIIAAAWWLGRAMLTAPRSALQSKRTHIAAAVVASVCATVPLMHVVRVDGGMTIPVVFSVMSTLLVLTLATAATVAALAARAEPVSPPVAALLVALPNLILAPIAPLSHMWGAMWLVSAAVALPFAAYVLAIVWWERVENPGKAWTAWIVSGAGLAAVSVPASYVFFLASMFVTPMLLAASGTAHPAEGITTVTATALFALVAAALAADWLAPVQRRAVTVAIPVEST